MPSRHSKNTGSRPHFTYHEKAKAHVSITQRLGSESQLPFGYCALSLAPAEDPVVSPSGRIYGREYILEYILTKTQELKKQQRLYEEQQEERRRAEEAKNAEARSESISKFVETHDGVKTTLKRKAEDSSNEPVKGYIDRTRQKKIDDTDDSERMAQLSHSAPWAPQFTPQAKDAEIKEPPKRPPSPFSGRSLRSKDLIPIDLIKETDGSASSSVVKYLCPVSRKTITNQKVVLIKSTGAYMIEQAAQDLAFPSMMCPLSGKKFSAEDVVTLCPALSGKAALGGVVASVHKPEFN